MRSKYEKFHTPQLPVNEPQRWSIRNDAVVNTPATAPTKVAESLPLRARNSVTTGRTYTVRFSTHNEIGIE